MKKFKENPEILMDLLRKPKNKPMVQELIANVLKIDFEDIEISPGIQKMDHYFISDPKFYLLELKGILVSGSKIELGIRFLDKDKLKENSFMYWTYLFSKELQHYDEDEVFDGLMMTNKLDIHQSNVERYHDAMHIGIQNQEGGILHEGVELHFIYLEKYIRGWEELEQWRNYTPYFADDFLLIGMKVEKEILQLNS